MAFFVRRLDVDGRRLAQSVKPDVVIASSTYPIDMWPAHHIAKLAGANADVTATAKHGVTVPGAVTRQPKNWMLTCTTFMTPN